MIVHDTVPDALGGERLDRVVAFIAGVTRSVAQLLVTDGAVQVGGVVVRAKTAKVASGDLLSIDRPDDALPTPLIADPTVEFMVIYEDEHLAVIDKPAGLVVHPGSGHQSGTLVHGILARYPEVAALAVGDRHERPGIVHRLDRGTSGLMIVARTAQAQGALTSMLARRDVSRRYLALVRGTTASDSGLVDAPIGRSEHDPTKMAVNVHGREARTGYRVLQRFEFPEPSTFVECTLETGRTHQIRVHLAAIGHAVSGDPRYGGKRGTIPSPRPFLHAYRLAFVHPVTDEAMEFSSELPPDLAHVLSLLS